jgi:hypothetical protein
MVVIMEPSMWHVNVIPWKAAYGPQVKNVCALNEKTMHGGGTPYVSQKWASVKIICEFPLPQMWSITPNVTVKIGKSQGKFSSF